MQSGVWVDNNVTGATAVFETLAIHGSGHRLEKWAEDTTKLVLTHPQVLDSCKMLSRVAAYAALLKDENFSREQALEVATNGCSDEQLAAHVGRLAEFLDAGKSPAEVANTFGWSSGIPTSMMPTAIMSLYCWLLEPEDFEAAVFSAIELGGDTQSMGATTGALVGAFKGVDAVPAKLREKLGGNPHSSEWIEKLAARLSHWPHGEHDLHMAPALPSDPILQLIRNLFVWLRYLLSRVGRLPRRLFGKSTPS